MMETITPNLPTQGNVTPEFTPLRPKPGTGAANPNINRGPFIDSPAFNPYGISRAQAAYGKSPILGGPQDMMKSVATRNLAIQQLQNQFEQEPMPSGLQAGLESYAQGNPYLSSMLTNYLPSLQSKALIQNQANRATLNDLLGGAYVLGGGLWGSQAGAWADAKAQDRARRLEHVKSVQAILTGIGSGLSVGGGGGGLGGGGGGGGGDMITNLVSGIYGASANT